MELEFFKYHGTGNDFILIDDRKGVFPGGNELVKAMCDRHFGIGADGLILLQEKAGYDFGMVYYNSDGNQSSMCGNGGRCLVAFADYLSLIRPETRFFAVDGAHTAIILGKHELIWQVRLKMSDVRGFDQVEDGFTINTGSPHLVIFGEDVQHTDVYARGKAIRNSEPFREEGINVDFAEWTGTQLYVRSYERGVENETLSCGTGVTASSLVFASAKGMDSGTVPVRTLGGELSVSFRRKGDSFSEVWLSGPAEMVFRGNYFIK